MNGALLQDIIRNGLGRAAIVIGDWCDLYRPSGTADPISAGNRILRMHASFAAASGYGQPVSFGQPTWHGVFDAAYTRPGDYLVRVSDTTQADDPATWFIAAQQPLLPILCVRASRTVSLARAAAPNAAGVNTYGGVTTAGNTVLATNWPASLLTAGGAGMDAAALPADGTPGAWSVMLPPIAGVALRAGDLLTDDLGRTGVVASAELTELGWRLLVKQATT